MQQTKAQKEISKLERQAKRTQAQTWADMEKLVEVLGVANGNASTLHSEIVKPGDDFYRQAMDAITCLRRLKRKTQENMVMWKPADEVVQRLLQVAKVVQIKT